MHLIFYLFLSEPYHAKLAQGENVKNKDEILRISKLSKMLAF